MLNAFSKLTYLKTWWAAVYVVAQSRTRLKRLSSSSSSQGLIGVVRTRCVGDGEVD